MKRFVSAALFGVLTILATVLSLVMRDPNLELLMVVAIGAPTTVFLAVRGLADPDRDGRSPWFSLVLGATVVPAVVLACHGLFVAVGYGLVMPLVDPVRELWEQLRADPDLFRVLTSGWALVLIVDLAIIAPLAEETTKPLAALVRRPRTARDAFLFGAAAGTGFAMIENVLYSSGWFYGSLAGWPPVAVLRMLGAGLHAFCAGLVAWGVFQLRTGESRRWRYFWMSLWVALTTHGLWNGSVAVAVVLATARETAGLRGRYDAYAWGVVLFVLLAALGVIILGALLSAARQIGKGRNPMQGLLTTDARSPRRIAAWGLVSSVFLIPATILILVFPHVIAL
ncbi:MAG: PrsW family glutamic-type intramembrane protease [Acidimicrobiia bacterium]|nr:PrsW family glutamic-type intramembrane protease [Acidimicrobiia bacterium]